MKPSLLLALAPPALASLTTWSPAGAGEVRGPCPMLNTLSNHGFLPHSGKDISNTNVHDALVGALNVHPDLAADLFEAALVTNPNANATTFSLSDLGRHGILEHDGSLSRKDAFFGDPTLFDAATFAQTASYWTADTIDLQMVADARMARLDTSLHSNPSFTFTETANNFDVGESAAYVIAFGDADAGTASRAMITYFFENERLPTELGWVKPAQVIDDAILTDVATRVVEHSFDNNATTPDPGARRRRGVQRPSSGRRDGQTPVRLRMH